MGASPVLFQQGSDPTALSVLTQAITGQMGFMDADFCTTCGEKGAAKRCSICKMVNILDPLGRSDHNIVYLQLVYSFLWIKNFPQPQCMWGNGLISEALRVVFETTEWEGLCGSYVEDINSMIHCVTDYIIFCGDGTAPTKRVRCFPSNKPWVMSELKTLLNEKKRLFRLGNKEGLRMVKNQPRWEIRKAKGGGAFST